MIEGSEPQGAFSADIMGAFVINFAHAEWLFCVGIPYWVVHPVRNLLHIHVDRLDDSVCAEDRVTMQPMLGTDVIYEGPADLVAQYQAISQTAGQCLGFDNPFKETSQPPTVSIRNSSASPSTGLTRSLGSINSKPHQPCESIYMSNFMADLVS